MELNNYEPLVEVVRGGMVESIHLGAVAVVDSRGNLISSLGNANKTVFLRSSAKPFQVIPLIEMGGMEKFGLTDRELAVMCASHSGTDEHVRAVEGIQKKIGVNESELLCGSHEPFDKPTAQALVERHEETTSNRNNCSGKHTGMLAQALLLNASKDDYIDPQHPVQVGILRIIGKMCDLQPGKVEIGIDGCSAPVFGVPLRNAALAYARLGDPTKLSEKRASAIHRITKAMTSYPDMVAGPGRFDTLLMQAGKGMIASKMGAEGFQGVTIMPDTHKMNSPASGICIKIADGDLSGRAVPVVTLEILNELGVLPQEITELKNTIGSRILFNFSGKQIGEIREAFTLDVHGKDIGPDTP